MEDEGGHRGGAWKVAYADFVTALMALFIVLWLLNSSQKVRDSVSSYFRHPKGHPQLSGSAHAGSGEALAISERTVSQLQERLKSSLAATPEFRKIAGHVHFTVTGEGLRIELSEDAGGMFFETGSPEPTEAGNRLFSLLAEELGKLPNPVALEGHTDSSPFRGAGQDSYGNWELSFDRANMARRRMTERGLRPEQIAEVRGYADRKPLVEDAADSRNRRISVIVRY